MAARLMLIEFYPCALRRNEKSMLFPFLQGFARECGCETLWLCFGSSLAPAAEGFGGRMLRAQLSDEDFDALARHVDAFAPSHVVTSDLLSVAAEALLGARTPPPEHLVMPTVSDVVFGSPAAPGMKLPHELISSDPRRLEYLARCGWFLRWLGVNKPGIAGRHIVTHAVPDYAAVMANASAAESQSAVTIVSGAICGRKSRLADNPSFAGVDLGKLRDHRGCSFCMSATIPPYTPPNADIIALWELQFRRLMETAPRGGRNKGLFEFFDYRAFRRIDEVAALVVRVGLPPSIFMFNPRIDEVLQSRKRLERVLPELGRAGHEVRILSMGVENFSERENERLNKGITLAQVDEFLALARAWESAHPGVFMPFKAGHDQIELGFILFTPWSTLEDLRVNVDCAAARHFSPTGYWMYSTLDIQEMEPMYCLAQQAGDILCERFPDRGQYYGVYLNETEVGHLVPWRFRDAKVADYFAMLVRVCAAEREGAACVFFRDDAEFALVERAYREAKKQAKITPLEVARPLLDVMAAAQPPYSRTALVHEVIGRVAGTPPAEPEGRGLPPPPPLSSTAAAVARAVERLSQDGPTTFRGLEFRPIRELGPPEERRIRLAFSLAGREVVVDLLAADPDGPCCARSRRFRAVYHKDTPITSPDHLERLASLLRLIDDGMETGQ